uniref:Uncharacterized protein n=1 Tax=Daphnia magna TaxID=35525 RepID=A0A0P6GZH7_9CRUS
MQKNVVLRQKHKRIFLGPHASNILFGGENKQKQNCPWSDGQMSLINRAGFLRTSFYLRLPRRRRTLFGEGRVINRWLPDATLEIPQGIWICALFC